MPLELLNVLKDSGPSVIITLILAYVLLNQDKRHDMTVQKFVNTVDAITQRFTDTVKEINNSNAQLQVDKTTYLVNVNQNTIKIVERNTKQLETITKNVALFAENIRSLTEAIRGSQKKHQQSG